MTTVLAIDQGTSGTKAVVVDENGQVLALSEVPVRPTYLPGGGVEQDPQALLDSVIQARRYAVNRAKVDIDVVTLANPGRNGPGVGPGNRDPIVEHDRL